ncbi:MAG: hypothetical protein KH354_03115 [Clostridiales bacterium]|nr:hypothetical protein [Clostridiales bacterium]
MKNALKSIALGKRSCYDVNENHHALTAIYLQKNRSQNLAAVNRLHAQTKKQPRFSLKHNRFGTIFEKRFNLSEASHDKRRNISHCHAPICDRQQLRAKRFFIPPK